jgi:hypothetical protein
MVTHLMTIFIKDCERDTNPSNGQQNLMNIGASALEWRRETENLN